MTDDVIPSTPQRPHADERAKAVELLRQAPFASFAVVDSGRPYVVPLNFAYEDSPAPHGRLVVHTGPGRKSAAMAANPRVCVTASAGEGFVQGDSPCSDGFAFSSVVAEGTARLLEDLPERLAALGAIVAKHDMSMADRPFDERVLARTLVYEIVIETLCYRELP
jgi:uncharacterized protein